MRFHAPLSLSLSLSLTHSPPPFLTSTASHPSCPDPLVAAVKKRDAFFFQVSVSWEPFPSRRRCHIYQHQQTPPPLPAVLEQSLCWINALRAGALATTSVDFDDEAQLVRRMVYWYQHFGRACCLHLQGLQCPEDEASSLLRNVDAYIRICTSFHRRRTAIIK